MVDIGFELAGLQIKKTILMLESFLLLVVDVEFEDLFSLAVKWELLWEF